MQKVLGTLSNYKKVLLFLIIVYVSQSNAQSITGMSGQFTIPTADLLEDKEIIFGINYLPKNAYPDYRSGFNNVIIFTSFSFLPFIELSLRSTYPLNYNQAAIGDRMPSLRIKLIKENNMIPSIAIGIHDFTAVFGGVEAIYFNSLYIVFSKNFTFDSFVKKVNISVGYGSDILKAARHHFVGIFFGYSIRLFNVLEVMNEYDSERFNVGIRLTVLKNIKIINGLIDFKHFTSGIALSFIL
jgi:hypothetical protein